MLETKPLTSSDHFVHRVQRAAGVDRSRLQPAPSVVVTISPEAAAILAGAQAQASAPGSRTDSGKQRRPRDGRDGSGVGAGPLSP